MHWNKCANWKHCHRHPNSFLRQKNLSFFVLLLWFRFKRFPVWTRFFFYAFRLRWPHNTYRHSSQPFDMQYKHVHDLHTLCFSVFPHKNGRRRRLRLRRRSITWRTKNCEFSHQCNLHPSSIGWPNQIGFFWSINRVKKQMIVCSHPETSRKQNNCAVENPVCDENPFDRITKILFPSTSFAAVFFLFNSFSILSSTFFLFFFAPYKFQH